MFEILTYATYWFSYRYTFKEILHSPSHCCHRLEDSLRWFSKRYPSWEPTQSCHPQSCKWGITGTGSFIKDSLSIERHNKTVPILHGMVIKHPCEIADDQQGDQRRKKKQGETTILDLNLHLSSTLQIEAAVFS